MSIPRRMQRKAHVFVYNPRNENPPPFFDAPPLQLQSAGIVKVSKYLAPTCTNKSRSATTPSGPCPLATPRQPRNLSAWACECTTRVRTTLQFRWAPGLPSGVCGDLHGSGIRFYNSNQVFGIFSRGMAQHYCGTLMSWSGPSVLSIPHDKQKFSKKVSFWAGNRRSNSGNRKLDQIKREMMYDRMDGVYWFVELGPTQQDLQCWVSEFIPRYSALRLFLGIFELFWR